MVEFKMANKIIKRFQYTSAAETDIRKTFQRWRENAEPKKWPVLDADLIQAGTAQREDQGISTAECH